MSRRHYQVTFPDPSTVPQGGFDEMMYMSMQMGEIDHETNGKLVKFPQSKKREMESATHQFYLDNLIKSAAD